MSHKLRFTALLLLVAAVAISGCGEGGDSGSTGTGAFALKTAPADDLATMCPEGAVAFVRIENFQKLEAEIKSLVATVAPTEVDDASILANLGKMMGNPTLEGMATGKPAGVALMMGDMGPMPIVIMPLSDQAAFESKVGQNPTVKVAGGHAVWAPDPSLLEGVRSGGKASKLASSLLSADIAIAVDMAAVQPLMAPGFAQMDQMVGMMKQQMPGPMGAMYGDMAGGMKRIMTDAGEIGMAANLVDGKLDMVFRYSAREGSETAKKIAAAKSAGKSLMGYIDGADLMAMEMSGSGEALWDWFGGIYEGMLAQTGPEALATLKKSFTLIDGMAVGISLEGGISESFVIGVTDEKKYEEVLDAMPGMFASLTEAMQGLMGDGDPFPMDMVFTPGETWEHAGVKVRSYSFKMDMKEIPDTTEVPPEAMAAMQKMLTKAFGGDTIDYHIAIVNGHAVGALGANARDRTAALIEKAKSGEPGEAPAAFAKATEGFPADTMMVFSMDFSPVLKLVSDMPEIPPEIQKRLANPPAGLGMSGFVSNDGEAVSFGMRYDLKTIVTYISSFMK